MGSPISRNFSESESMNLQLCPQGVEVAFVLSAFPSLILPVLSVGRPLESLLTLVSGPTHCILRVWQRYKETTLERADFLTGWQDLIWF